MHCESRSKVQRATRFFPYCRNRAMVLLYASMGIAEWKCHCSVALCAFVARHTTESGKNAENRAEMIEEQSTRKMGKALKAQWILKLSWSSKKQLWKRVLIKNPFNGVIWERPMKMLSLYVYWSVVRLSMTYVLTNISHSICDVLWMAAPKAQARSLFNGA